MEWINIDYNQPHEECEILFIAKHGITDERIGTAIPDLQIVILSHTEIDFDDLLYWIKIPEPPKDDDDYNRPKCKRTTKPLIIISRKKRGTPNYGDE